MQKRFFILTIVLFFLLILITSLIVFFVDPCFLYREPSYSYFLQDERFQNNGILKTFDYDSVITGTSMTQNFRASEFDSLFNCQSIKVCNSGGSFKEIHDRLATGFSSDNTIRFVVWGLDYGYLLSDKDTMYYSDLPDYLYNDSVFDDYKYLLSKDYLALSIKCLINTIQKKKPTSFDEYSYWGDKYSYGKSIVDKTYNRSEKKGIVKPFTDADYHVLFENINQNILSLIDDNPQTDFYLFFTPYSIYYFDSLNQEGSLEKSLELHEYALQLMLDVPNIRLFSFMDMYSVTDDLDNYKDMYHYGEWVNAEMLNCMKNDEHRLTADNFERYCADVRDHYLNYDYDGDFADQPE